MPASALPQATRPREGLHNVHFAARRIRMPTIRVELFEGRTPEQKKNLVTALTQACVETLGSNPESVDILLYDIKPSDWATGGELWSDKKKQG
jgi:4-oxalocrotonate tautomerase